MAISIHAPREGGDDGVVELLTSGVLFQSTPPARGATNRRELDAARIKDFNPRPPRGGRHFISCISFALTVFQSTPPARGATKKLQIISA